LHRIKLELLKQIYRISNGKVQFVEIRRNIKGESKYLLTTDAKKRRQGEQTRLDTLVVLAVNYNYLLLNILIVQQAR